MASYRPYSAPHQSSFAPHSQPPPPQGAGGGSYLSQSGYSSGGSGYGRAPPSSVSNGYYGQQQYQYAPSSQWPPAYQIPPPPQPQQSQMYYPPPPERQPLPPPPPSQPVQYSSQYNPLQPPSAPPSSPPPPTDAALIHHRSSGKPPIPQPHSATKLKPPEPSLKPQPKPSQTVHLQHKRAETEDERRQRKKREYEKQRQVEKQRQEEKRQEEKRLQMLKQSQKHVLQKTQMIIGGNNSATAVKGHGSLVGSRLADRRSTPLLSGERVENRLKKPTTFVCKLKFRNELPDPTAQPKLLVMNSDKERYNKYTITSSEKVHKPKLYTDPDLGVPLDLLDIRVYNASASELRPPLDPLDEDLLRDEEVTTPIKQDGVRIKERPTDKGVSWLVKTQYISPLSAEAAKTSLTEKQAKEMRETKKGRNLFLENLNNRERQIQAIEESFKAAKLLPVHQTNPALEPLEIFPLLPDFERYDERFVMVSFDGDPTADAEMYNKLEQSVRDEHESRAIMKSFTARGSDPSKPEKFLAYMAPSQGELFKDMYNGDEDISYNWVREYHWEVRGDDAEDPQTYLVSFEDETARYLPLPTKLILQKKKAKEGRSGDDSEHFPVPSKVTVRRREVVAVEEGTSSSHDKVEMGLKRRRVLRDDDFVGDDGLEQNGREKMDGTDDFDEYASD